MSRLPGLYQWQRIIARHFPTLSKPLTTCLALWSLGMILARSCSLTAVAWVWVPLLQQKFYTLRERLRAQLEVERAAHRRELARVRAAAARLVLAADRNSSRFHAMLIAERVARIPGRSA